MNDVIKNIESINNKPFTGSKAELKDLLINLDADSLFNKDDWSSMDHFILSYLKDLNKIYLLEDNKSNLTEKSISFIGITTKEMPQEYGYNYSNAAYKALRKFFKLRLYQDHITQVWTSLSHGTEWCLAHAVIEMRELGFPIKLNCVLPTQDTSLVFKKYLNLYQNIIRRADTVQFLSNDPQTEKLYDEKNQYLIDKNEYIYFIEDINHPKFEKELNVARQKNKKISIFNINKLNIE